MKTRLGFFLQSVPFVLLDYFAVAQTPVTQPQSVQTTSAVVSQLEDEFLANVEKTTEPEHVFDDYETQLQKLIDKHPESPAPFLGLMELFEKCGTPRTRRLVDQVLGREQLPEKVRPAYERIRKQVGLIGRPFELELVALDGRTVRFDEFRGKVVVIDFWATWCGPCVRDLPKLQGLHAKHQQDGLVVVGVSFDRERAKLDAFLLARAIPWTQIYPDGAAKEKIAEVLAVTGGYLPTVYIIGRDGRLRHTLNSRFQTAEKVAALLKE